MINVLMLGPARSVKGGMTTVVDNYYLCGLDQEVNLKYIETCNDKNVISKVIKEIKGFLLFLANYRKYNVIHIHMASRRSTFRKGIYAFLAKKQRKKVILHIHGAEYKMFYDECNQKKKKKIKNILNLADKIVVLSEEWKEYFERFVESGKIEIIYNSVILPDNFKKNFSENKLLFLGRLGDRKGIYDLLEVLKNISKDNTNWLLNIGGDGEVEQVKKIIKDNSLEKNIKYMGWISGTEKEQLLKDSNIYILPSYNEGMPMSVLEAMAYKNITISTNVGGLPKVIKNNYNGYIINPGDKKELEKIIRKILQGEIDINKISENAMQTIEEKFNANRNLKKLISIYKNVKEVE